MHDVAKSLQVLRMAISAETHHFVFIAEFQEAQKLRDGAVKQSQRMRKRHRALNVHAIAVAHTPHGAGKIAQTVGGNQRRLFERRNKKTAGQMRFMMLDAMKSGFQAFCDRSSNAAAKRFRYSGKGSQNLSALPGKRRHPQRIK